MSDSNNPEFLLFAQHGWADKGNDIGKLATAAANSDLVIAPSLGLIKTFIRIDSLVEQIEHIASPIIDRYPHTPIKIIGHSMGGLMWLEVLNRNPQWWHKVHSLILLGSPVGGSDIARVIDPFSIGIGTAKCLGKNRRQIAEKIARQIPTLSVASDLKMGSDGLVTVESTKFAHANWLLISQMPHTAMKYHPQMIPIIQKFWANPQLGSPPQTDFATQSIEILRSVTGMTDANYRNFERSQIRVSLADSTKIHTWNTLGLNYVFVSQQGRCRYAGYVGWIHAGELNKAIAKIKQNT